MDATGTAAARPSWRSSWTTSSALRIWATAGGWCVDRSRRITRAISTMGAETGTTAAGRHSTRIACQWRTILSGTRPTERTLLWKEITEAHSPLLPTERARIEDANGWIIRETEIPIGQLHRMDIFDEDVVEIVKRCFADRMKQHRSDPVRRLQIGRTCGDLAVSRAIGDRDFKAAYNLPVDNGAGTATGVGRKYNDDDLLARSWEGPLVFIYPPEHSGRFRGDIVSNVPDIRTFRVGLPGVDDEFLLMACDGLWDVVDGDDAVRIAKDLLFDKGMSAREGAARLAELAQHLGSSDNITVILIRFYWEKRKD
mmetsp:Transcript_28931/g.69739  ORF Transcript_28931/g.69739 Transcript_28931/m.69739 type:complete len:312 (-) Transcript_28931:755-1690(-)